MRASRPRWLPEVDGRNNIFVLLFAISLLALRQSSLEHA